VFVATVTVTITRNRPSLADDTPARHAGTGRRFMGITNEDQIRPPENGQQAPQFMGSVTPPSTAGATGDGHLDDPVRPTRPCSRPPHDRPVRVAGRGRRAPTLANLKDLAVAATVTECPGPTVAVAETVLSGPLANVHGHAVLVCEVDSVKACDLALATTDITAVGGQIVERHGTGLTFVRFCPGGRPVLRVAKLVAATVGDAVALDGCPSGGPVVRGWTARDACGRPTPLGWVQT